MKYVNCKTEREANILLNMLHDNRYRWNGGKQLYNNTKWFVYKDDTIYCINEEHKTVSYCDINPEMTLEQSEIIDCFDYMKVA